MSPVLCAANQLACKNLVEGRQYEFRVTAVNEAGMSPPSSNTQAVKVQDPKGKIYEVLLGKYWKDLFTHLILLNIFFCLDKIAIQFGYTVFHGHSATI